jgi:hypothetical protein
VFATRLLKPLRLESYARDRRRAACGINVR